MRTVLIQADYTTVTSPLGLFPDRTVPDLGTLTPYISETGPGHYFAQWQTGTALHFFAIKELPSLVDGQRWFIGSGDANLVGALVSNGVAGSRIYNNPPMPKRQAFIDAGVPTLRKVSDNSVVGLAPTVVLAGQSPLSVALAAITPEEGEEYYVE